MSKRNAKPLLLPLVLALSLTGCATNSTLSPAPPQPVKIPPPPAELMQEPSNESYSDSVQRLLYQWQQRLIEWRRRS